MVWSGEGVCEAVSIFLGGTEMVPLMYSFD